MKAKPKYSDAKKRAKKPESIKGNSTAVSRACDRFFKDRGIPQHNTSRSFIQDPSN